MKNKKRLMAAILSAALAFTPVYTFAASAAPAEEASKAAPGASSTSVTYSGATEITAKDSQTKGTYESTKADENALLINTSDAVTVTNPTVTKSGDSDGGDNCNFYGINSAVMVKGGTTTTITGGTVTTSAKGANGVFSYGGNGGKNGAAGDGTKVVITNTKITTTGSNAGGIMTTGGGITEANDLTIETSGQSSAPIRTDRGGGTVTVNGGTYTSNGLGSPAVYSTADITVNDATLISNKSEGVCIEGKNSVKLKKTNLTVNNTDLNGNATFKDAIMIYQSMSGDADSGKSAFTMEDGSLTNKSGHVFHVTNTTAAISLKNVKITNEDSENVLISVCNDGWSGAENKASLSAENQTLKGNALVGLGSTLDIELKESSKWTGTVSGTIVNAKGSAVSSQLGTVNVTLSSSSEWTLTADTYITSFSGDLANVKSNGYKLYVDGKEQSGLGTAAAAAAETTPAATATTEQTQTETTAQTEVKELQASAAALSPVKKKVAAGKSYTIKVTGLNDQTAVFKLSAAAKKAGVKVNSKTGKVTVPKKAKSGAKYVIVVKVKQSENYKAKTLKFKVIIK